MLFLLIFDSSTAAVGRTVSVGSAACVAGPGVPFAPPEPPALFAGADLLLFAPLQPARNAAMPRPPSAAPRNACRRLERRCQYPVSSIAPLRRRARTRR